MTTHTKADHPAGAESYTVEVRFDYQDDCTSDRERASSAAHRVARFAARLAHSIDPDVAVTVRSSTGSLLAGKAVYLPDDRTRAPSRASDRRRGDLGRDLFGGGR